MSQVKCPFNDCNYIFKIKPKRIFTTCWKCLRKIRIRRNLYKISHK